MKNIQVLVVDDHPLIREGLRKILALEAGITVVAEAGDGVQAIEAARRYRPDVILMDINMPKMNGIDATRIIREDVPSAGIVALTIHDDEQYVLELIRAGISGYVLKDIDAHELIQAIRRVANGESVIHPAITKKVFGELRRSAYSEPKTWEDLTERELEVLAHIAHGEANKVIANRLCISEKTVKNHISSIFRKLGVTDRTQAALFAVKNKLVEV
ncbi:chemotaxis protein CheY [Clostridiales bacterium PH28_bin88]|nr:chemotaxis protein CheY [Clostridiales bacterium PH28_bin88]